MKTSEGIVLETDGKAAKVRAGMHIECESCGMCPGSNAPVVTVSNRIGARVGQRVLFEVKEDQPLKGALLIFVLPLVAFFAGVWCGGMVFASLSWNESAGKIVGGIVFTAAAVVVVWFADKKIGRKLGSLPSIIKIVD